jgi:hypothetical protein
MTDHTCADSWVTDTPKLLYSAVFLVLAVGAVFVVVAVLVVLVLVLYIFVAPTPLPTPLPTRLHRSIPTGQDFKHNHHTTPNAPTPLPTPLPTAPVPYTPSTLSARQCISAIVPEEELQKHRLYSYMCVYDEADYPGGMGGGVGGGGSGSDSDRGGEEWVCGRKKRPLKQVQGAKRR